MKVIDMIRYAKMFASHGIYFFKKQSDSSLEKERLLGEILRNTHSIEKGLSLENVRKGFGVKKIEEASSLIRQFILLGGSKESVPIQMFVSALSSYLEYHKQMNWSDSNVEKVMLIFENLKNEVGLPSEKKGGIISVKKNDYTEEQMTTIESLFKSRHSVREFDGTPVDPLDLKSAIMLAMRCPSACNRQCYRVHIVHKSAFQKLNNWMDGIGGFSDDIDKLLIITGNISVYRLGEIYQHVVTSSVFASYLTLSLQAYGIGCCFIQRDVIPNKRWKTLSKKLDIPANEEVVCCLGIGNLKPEYKVPISYRLPYNAIVNEIK